ncbi:MAG: ABC transporter permease subunit, partial [Pirellulales bacterium]|nr:ABC transporter permease subunit [Pirellulales bacterium]
MSWNNVKLILGREVRDQLRDRRTLFMIAVLPLLLYPLLGMSFMQVMQFMQERPTKVLVIGEPDIELLDHLFEREKDEDGEPGELLKTTQGDLLFNYELFEAAEDRTAEQQAKLLPVTFKTLPTDATSSASAAEQFAAQQKEAKTIARRSDHEVVVLFPPGFAKRLAERSKSPPGTSADEADAINPFIFSNSSREKSKIAYNRVDRALNRWMERISDKVLEQHRIPITATRPFEVQTVDVAAKGHKHALIWAKLLPFVLLIWALTGAFYPAVDLCAGEKERGTLETLLSSPAERSEIVVGKLLTIMLFSVVTAVLNLISLGMTGTLILSQISQQIGPPPWDAMIWLFVALVPVSALFSAVCLALAAVARSTKEGQYYLMPVMLITMPLVMLPMSPGVEMTLGNSLVPVMGIVLLLRTTLEGDYVTAARYLIPALGVTLICCLLAIRWAIDQFNKESVLFRESERFDLNLWFKQLFRDREPTPTVAAAFLCGLLILMLR